jgi:hypothetical protein
MGAALTPGERAALETVAGRLAVSPTWLYNLIQFESRWKPDIKNPLTSARGLIQFLDSTAQDLGYDDSLDLVRQNPTREAQLLGPVYSYLKRYAPFPTEQSLYMAVFYPKARNWPPNQPFPAKVQAVNPGIKTPMDYVAWVRRLAGAAVPGMALLLAAGVAAFFFLSKKGSA